MDKEDTSHSNLKDLRKTFTLDDATLKEINAFMGIHRLTSMSEALRGIIAEYKVLKEQNGHIEGQPQNNDLPPCDFLVLSSKPNMVDCSKDFSEKGRIHKVTMSFCRNCWKLKEEQRERAEQALRRMGWLVSNDAILETQETQIP
jgi:hypothetical protein